MPNEVKLLPCPFCGVDEPMVGGAEPFYWVECRDCPAVIEAETEDEAIAAWNHRPTTVVTDEVVVSAAAAIVDIWMGGDTAWRARLDDSDFLESTDWQNALELARAALASMPTVVTGEQPGCG